jgi:hypothetical protein
MGDVMGILKVRKRRSKTYYGFKIYADGITRVGIVPAKTREQAIKKIKKAWNVKEIYSVKKIG